MTYNEIIYMCLDELKLSSDDSFYTKDHILFLIVKLRSFLLKQRYSDIKKQIPDSNYQTICLSLEEVAAIDGEPCSGGFYLRSTQQVPTTMKIGNPRVTPLDFYQGEISYISRDRMRYIGWNKFLKNIIYCSKSPEGYLYFKAINPQFLYLEQVRFTAIFEDATKASELACEEDGVKCELIDREFPIEEALVAPLIGLVVEALRGPEYAPKDNDNNAHDDLADINNGNTRRV